MKEELRDLPCKLTESEIRAAAKEHVQVCAKLAETEAEKKIKVSEFKLKLDSLKGAEKKLRDAHETGVEHRSVICVEHEDLTRGVRFWVRTDTGETLGQEIPIDPVELSRLRDKAAQADLFASKH